MLAFGIAVVHQLAGDQLAVLVVDGLLVERLAQALHDAAVHLAIHEHRVDDVADIVHRHVAFDVHLPGVAIHFRHHDVRAEREREVRRLPEVRRHHARLGLGRQFHGAIGGAGDLRQRLPTCPILLQVQAPPANVTSSDSSSISPNFLALAFRSCSAK